MQYRDSHRPYGSMPVYLYLDQPRSAWQWSALPAEGVGLLRLEHLIGQEIGIHPMALIDFERVTNDQARRIIEERTRMHPCKEELFIEVLSRHIARIALQFAPRRIFVRFSDYNSAEYTRLVGGDVFEPNEACPELGLRGAARYCSDIYRPGFELECRAIHCARERYGAVNVSANIPFCRTLEEADEVLALMARQGLLRGREDLQVYVMAEVPSNIILASEFASRFDGFTVGTGDLAQLIWGMDCSSCLLDRIDTGGIAVRRVIAELVSKAHDADTPVQVAGPTVTAPGFFEFLLDVGVDAVTVRPEEFGRACERIRHYYGDGHGDDTAAQPGSGQHTETSTLRS